ncbi:hypothetical protein JHK87_047762 [Glycine soja]|nr:hypothetical protein JHK87_047762 [Glycine soja]
MHDGVPYVAQPWFQYLSENNLMAGDEFLFKLMARIDDKIKTIDGSKENLKLAIRITELWFVGMSGRSEQAEMVIIDSDEGDLDLNASPKALDKLLGHLLAFKQSISIIANHDPLIGLPLTPTKRQSFHECEDEARSSLISPAQLSSNKLAKHDQIE